MDEIYQLGPAATVGRFVRYILWALAVVLLVSQNTAKKNGVLSNKSKHPKAIAPGLRKARRLVDTRWEELQSDSDQGADHGSMARYGFWRLDPCKMEQNLVLFCYGQNDLLKKKMREFGTSVAGAALYIPH